MSSLTVNCAFCSRRRTAANEKGLRQLGWAYYISHGSCEELDVQVWACNGCTKTALEEMVKVREVNVSYDPFGPNCPTLTFGGGNG
jgi:hypothetical protein